ncbi:hypothetical protein ACQBAU_15450 [Propionibacteriaceae bacterium Y2011]
MVALLTRLKWRLWRGSYQQDKRRLIGPIIGVAYALFAMVGAAVGLFASALFLPTMTMPLLVAVGAVLVLMWTIIPIFTFGIDDTLAASKFAIYPLRAKDLQPGLFAAAFISIPIACTALGVLVMIIVGELALFRAAAADGGIGAATVIGAILLPVLYAVGLALCVLLPRAIVTATTIGGVSRRRREVAGIGFFVVFIGGMYGLQIAFTAEAERLARLDPMQIMDRVGTIAGWTPLGAPFAVPYDVATGSWLSAVARLAITALLVVGAWLVWRVALDRTLITGALDSQSTGGHELKGSFIPRFFPTNALGAVAGRSLRYWRRDQRYLMTVIMMPIMSVLFIALSVVQDVPFMALMGPCMMAWAAIPLMNDFGYDGPASWVNFTAGLDARTNLMGRALAVLTFMVPLIVVFAISGMIIVGHPEWIWPLLGGALGLTLCSVGTAAVLSTLLPYRVNSPGTSSFKSSSGSGASAFLNVLVGMFGITIPIIPAAVVYVLGIVVWPWLLWLAPLVALLSGAIVLALGWHHGTKLLTRREPEIFATVRQWAN